MSSVRITSAPTLAPVRTAAAAGVGALSRAWQTYQGARAWLQLERSWVALITVVGLVAGTAYLWLGHFPLFMWLLVAAFPALVVWAWRQRHWEAEQADPEQAWSWWYPRQWLCRMLLLPTGTTALAVLATTWQPRVLTSALATAGILHLLWVMEGAEPEADSRWQQERLLPALHSAKVLPPDEDVRRLGPPQQDETGEWSTFQIPPGHVWQDWQNRTAALASAFDVDEDLLTVEHAGGPPNRVRVHIANRVEPPARVVVRSRLADSPRTDWRDPVRVGVDHEARVVALETDEHNTLVAGLPGYGKTSCARLLLSHFLLDPSTVLYGADGKGSRKDYAALAPLCERWVWGTDEDAPEQLLELLTEVLAVIRQRNADSTEHTRWPGLLLLLEEFQDIRAGAGKKDQDEIDNLLGRIVRMGRAVSVHVLFSTQRPSVQDLPSGSRNLIDQRVGFYFRNPRDSELVIGYLPKHLPMPKAKGEAIVADASSDALVTVDFLDTADFRGVCARAAELRPSRRAAGEEPAQVVLVKAEPIEAAPVTVVDAAVQVLLRAGPLRAATLFELLPDGLRPTSVATLGRQLGRDARLLSRRTADGTVWAVAADTNAPAVRAAAPGLSVNAPGEALLSPPSSPAVRDVTR